MWVRTLKDFSGSACHREQGSDGGLVLEVSFAMFLVFKIKENYLSVVFLMFFVVGFFVDGLFQEGFKQIIFSVLQECLLRLIYETPQAYSPRRGASSRLIILQSKVLNSSNKRPNQF